MFAHYRAAFRAPGSIAFCAASFVARMPIAIYPLGLILLFSQGQGDDSGGGQFGVAGLLEGCFIIAAGVGNPLVARLIDRLGQTRVLLPAALAHTASAVALVALYEIHVPDAVIAIPVMGLGLTYLPIGSLVRSRWSYVLAGRPELGTAYSIESTLDELIFTVGPIVAAVLTTMVDPLAGIVLGAVLVAAGSMWLRAQPRYGPAAGRAHRGGPPVGAAPPGDGAAERGHDRHGRGVRHGGGHRGRVREPARRPGPDRPRAGRVRGRQRPGRVWPTAPGSGAPRCRCAS